jgi:PAS domain S-box-containing protein
MEGLGPVTDADAVDASDARRHVQVLVADDRNRELLAEWLDDTYTVTAPATEDGVTETFDCALVDADAFTRYRDRIETWKTDAHPVFLPVVLVSDTLPSEDLDPADWDDIDGLYVIDEVVDTPVEQSVLHRRLANLLERRTLSHRLADDLERSERRFRALFDGTPDPVFVLSPAHELRYVNDALRDLFAVDDSLLGRSLPDLSVFSAETAAAIGELVDQRFAGERPPTEIVTFDTPDGGSRYAELNVGTIETGADADAAVVIMRDVTERRERARRFEQIAESVSEVIWMTDADGEDLLYLSPGFEALTGRPAAEFGDDPAAFLDIVHPDDREDYVADVADLVRSGEDGSRHAEIRIQRPDGETRWIEVDVYAVTHGDEVLRYVGLAEDITELKRRERDLEAKNERLDRFASLVSHDLRNPLQAATTRLELARERDEPEHLDHVEENLARMDRLVTDILNLARQGEAVTDPEPVAVDDLAVRAWAAVDHGTATLVAETGATLDADPDRLVQLFENLFRNAIEHAGTEATVRIGLLPDDTGFYVEDDGPGVPPDERESVFEMGYTTRETGTGFGLAIVREIAEAHGWLVAVTDGCTERDGAETDESPADDAAVRGNGGARFVFTNVDIR